ncbi:hypothetical protein DV737_g5063, partial [Chaetothyriales sp. CBS 132003]
MAPAARAEVAFASLKNCLVNLPPNLIALLSNTNTPVQNVVIELQYRSQTLSAASVSSGGHAGFLRSVYAGWTGMPSRTRPASVVNVDRSRPGSKELEVQVVEIDATFAKLLGLSEGQKVGLLVHLDPPLAHTVNIEPLTPADWEAIELHATFLELNMLQQIRALPNPTFATKSSTSVELNHPLTLHLSPTSTANITVTSIVPPQGPTVGFVKIAPDAEVIVAPKTRAQPSRPGRTDSRSITSRRSRKSGASNGRSAAGRQSSSFKSAIFARAIDCGATASFFPRHASSPGLQLWLGADLIASEPLKGAKYASVAIVKPSGLRGQLDQTQMQRLKEEESSDVGRPSSKLVAEIVQWETPIDAHHVGVSPVLSNLLGIEGLVGTILRIEPAFKPLHHSSIQSLILFPFALDATQKREGLKFGGDSRATRQATIDKLRIAHDTPDGLLQGPITDGMLLPTSGDPKSSSHFPGGILRFQQRGGNDASSSDGLTWAIGREQRYDFDVKQEVPRPLELTTLFPAFAHDIPQTGPLLIGVDPLLRQCMSNLTLCSSVLVTGGIGSGKTSIAYELARRLREDHLFNVTYFSCQRLVTDETRISTIKETLSRLFMSASWCARLGGQSVVVLDDLDKICPIETELQVGNDNGRSRQVTELLCAVVRQYCSIYSGVALLATAQSKDSLHNLIISGHIVGDIISIKSPTKEIRRDILQSIVTRASSRSSPVNGIASHSRNSSNEHAISESSWMDPSNPSSRPGSSSSSLADGFSLSPDLDLLDIAAKTDGYMPADLALLISRAKNETLTRSLISADINETSLTMTKSDFDGALRNFTPSSLRNVTLTHSTTTFSSIGGLQATRKTLLETLMYPTKYAPIFAKSPLRLRSGLLLYGYPGCGKTLLASAVAGECNLNFISVKGPEILNKYIGASEKSIRDLFERAQAAKPCVLFFDEFDSIAPKRGHDSTGVTDRVVNQMLTQMDGAEGLDGVYVLAATSRPDLIDPALLRPGRLDKSLICDMPDAEDRLDILRAVSCKLKLRPDVANRLLTVAERTNGFTGADLQALMYNAHLEAIHDLLGDRGSAGGKSSTPNGTHPGSRKGSASSYSASRFLYGAEEDAKARRTGSPSLMQSKAAVAAKLDELKLLRKKERAISRGDYSASSLSAASSSTQAGKSTGQQESREEGGRDEGVIIEWKHVERSLATTRSSISPEERNRLQAIYTEFVVGRKGDMPNGQGGNEIGGRTSLM